MTRFLSVLALLAIATLALAQNRIGAAEFEAYVQGKTLYYGEDGQAYGVEEYLDNRRVRWSFLDGRCVDGEWYEDDGDICFVYEDNPLPQCWAFFLEGGRLSAQFVNTPEAQTLYEVNQGDEPMLCLGPEIGV